MIKIAQQACLAVTVAEVKLNRLFIIHLVFSVGLGSRKRVSLF